MLIFDKTVKLGNGYQVLDGTLVCDVFFRDKHLAEYFPLYQTD
jgi:hypothetical protein